jgi:hypothetical protein
MSSGIPQANGSILVEPRMDARHVAEAALYVASLPLDANAEFMTVMATAMPFIGRGGYLGFGAGAHVRGLLLSARPRLTGGHPTWRICTRNLTHPLCHAGSVSILKHLVSVY